MSFAYCPSGPRKHQQAGVSIIRSVITMSRVVSAWVDDLAKWDSVRMQKALQ